MSRVGKQPISVPKGVKIAVQDAVFIAEGPKGRIEQPFGSACDVKVSETEISVLRKGESGPDRAQHGLIRALLANAVTGVTTGFEKKLEIVGVGYRGEVKGREVHLSLGFSHPIVFPIPDGIDIDIDKSNRIQITGADRQRVGQVAAEIRSLRPPDPYKAKGIRYSDEVIRRKVGKAGAR